MDIKSDEINGCNKTSTDISAGLVFSRNASGLPEGSVFAKSILFKIPKHISLSPCI